MSSLWAERVLPYTPVDNLVFMEELQSQHHTGRIEAAEMRNTSLVPQAPKSLTPGVPSQSCAGGRPQGGGVGGGAERRDLRWWAGRRGGASGGGQEGQGAGMKTHTARGSENTSLWMCSIRSPPAEYSITKHTCSGVWKQPKRFTRKGCPALVTAAKIRFSHIRLGRRQKSEPGCPAHTHASRAHSDICWVALLCNFEQLDSFSFRETVQGYKAHADRQSKSMLGTAWEPVGSFNRPAPCED